ncbi:hypothetical protein [Wenyingzhuangia sp. IMCC45467]|tara:strand:+ start:1533 stop:1964 length:432 start_codon:yes stop_codon:yes gene_type:complete
MKQRIINLVLVISLGFFINCNNKDNDINCSLVNCFAGDIVKLTFLKNDQNIFETEANTEISITQNNKAVDFNLNTETNQVTLFLYDDSPLTLFINDQQLNMEISSTFIESECCSGIEINSLKISNIEICNDKSCNEVLSIEIN